MANRITSGEEPNRRNGPWGLFLLAIPAPERQPFRIGAFALTPVQARFS